MNKILTHIFLVTFIVISFIVTHQIDITNLKSHSTKLSYPGFLLSSTIGNKYLDPGLIVKTEGLNSNTVDPGLIV